MLDMESLLSIAAVALATAAAVYSILSLMIRVGPKPKLPPGPRGWPIIGSLGILKGTIHRVLARLAGQYGPLMSIRVGSRLAVVATSPEMAREVLQTHDQTFASRPPLMIYDVISYGGRDMGSQSYNPYFRFLRKLTATELFSANRVKQFQNLRTELILETMSTIHKESEGGKGVLIHDSLLLLTANNITQMLIKKSLYGSKAAANQADESREFIAAVEELFACLAVPNIGDYIPFLKRFDIQGLKGRYKKAMAGFDKVIEMVLEDHTLQKGGTSKAEDCEIKSTLSEVPSLVQILSSIESLETEDAKFVDRRLMMKGLLQNMLFGGTDTTGNTVHWAMCALMKNPKIMERVQKELDEVVGSNRIVEESDIPQLHYLEAVVKETFRMYPVAPLLIPHYSSETCIIGGYLIPANTIIIVNNWAIGRDPKIWKDPLEFNPSRFLNSPVNVKGQYFEFLPFGAGRRMCPALGLALALLNSTLAHLLHAFKWSLPPGQSPKDLDLSEVPDGTHPAAPIEFCSSLRYPAGPYSSLLKQN